ncbi:MAG TPA: fatty acid--CoA ligase family protein [Thermodesulfovibrionia bacterium]|nr:fatty acid--CoA ligase family protein [Thermodesulfovibrionia bacterium]
MKRHWFVEKIAAYGNITAIVDSDRTFSYSELVQEVDNIRAFLDSHNVSQSEVTAIVGDYAFRSIAAFLALMENRNILVPVTSTVEHEIEEKLNESYADKAIYFRKSELELNAFEFRAKHSLIQSLQHKQSAGLILFSSGSTGKPKALVENLDEIVEHYRRGHAGFRTLVFLMFDHIGGVNTLFHILTSAGTAVLTHTREPDHVCRLIETWQVQALPTSPTFLNLLLLSETYKNYNLESLKLITYGTESMPAALLKRLKEVFPKTRLKQTFGTTETGILSTKSKADDSLFMKIGGRGFEHKIVDGQLYIKSKTAMLGYLNAANPFTEDGWFPTGDLVEEDRDGYIRIIGRIKEVINVGGAKVLPSEVETVVHEIPFVKDVMAYGESNAITGQSVAVDVVVEGKDDAMEIKNEIRSFCRSRLDRFKVPVRINIVNEINFGNRFKRVRKNVR